MKIKQMTINKKCNIMTFDTKVVFKNEDKPLKTFMDGLYENVTRGNSVLLPGNLIAEGATENSSFMVKISNSDGTPLMIIAGAKSLDEIEIAKFTIELFLQKLGLYNMLPEEWKNLREPFICDFIFPDIVLPSKINFCSIVLAKCFAARVFENDHATIKAEKPVKQLRKSLMDLPRHMVKDGQYPGIPEELEPYHFWIADSGNNIMCVPKCLLEKAKCLGDTRLWRYECPVSCSYVLRERYEFYDGYVIVDVPYDEQLGVLDNEYNW